MIFLGGENVLLLPPFTAVHSLASVLGILKEIKIWCATKPKKVLLRTLYEKLNFNIIYKFLLKATSPEALMAVGMCCSPQSGLPNRHDLLLLLLLLLILHLATTMHGRMSALTLRASVDSAGDVPSLAQPVPCPTASDSIDTSWWIWSLSWVRLCRCSHGCFKFSGRFTWHTMYGK